MNPDTDGELETFGLLQLLIQVAHSSEDTQGSSYSPMRIVFMGLGIAEVHEQTVTEQLGDMSIVALDNFGTHPLIRTDHVTPVFWVELRGQFCGVHEVTEEDRELAAFSFGRGRGD